AYRNPAAIDTDAECVRATSNEVSPGQLVLERRGNGQCACPRHHSTCSKRIEDCGHDWVQRLRVSVVDLNVTRGLGRGKNGCGLRGLLHFLFLVERAREIKNSYDEHHQQRKANSQLDQRRSIASAQKPAADISQPLHQFSIRVCAEAESRTLC